MLALAPCAALAQLPSPIFTRQNTFAIPFRLDRPDRAAELEVELYVSTDAGQSWKLEARQPASQRNFVFRAPLDGEYQFFVRTVDAASSSPPANRAELRVIVDTTPPEVELRADRGPGGEIVAQWTIRDLYLKADGLVLEHQPEGAGLAWQNVAIDPIPTATGKVQFTGHASWMPGGEADSSAGGVAQAIAVRCELTDLAGNRSVAQASVPAGQPATAGAPPPTTGAWPADQLADRPLPSGAEAGEELPTPTGQSAAPLAENDPRHTSGRLASRAGDPETIPPPGAPRGRPYPAAYDAGAPVAAGFDEPPAEEIAPEAVTPERFEEAPGTPTRSSRSPIRPGKPSGLARDLELLPEGVVPETINSRQFELDYEVESVGSSGIARVVLWGTTDGGQTWSNYGLDDDNESPLAAGVEGEGVYGFRITVEGGNGLGGRPPKPGEEPDVWLAVDLTKPFARLLPWEPSLDEADAALIVRWEASDEQLAERPIALAYSDAPTGPWTTIEESLENSGEYRWTFSPETPERVYLRLEVRDEAGNLRIVESREPALLDRLRPQGHIRGVRPSATGSGPRAGAIRAR